MKGELFLTMIKLIFFSGPIVLVLNYMEVITIGKTLETILIAFYGIIVFGVIMKMFIGGK